MPLPQALQLKVSDDRILHGWAWPAPSETVGQLLLVHGLGEHARRYDRLANTLWANGWHVLAYDQLGHGHSLSVVALVGNRSADAPEAETSIIRSQCSKIRGR